jgi:hypothetical protein
LPFICSTPSTSGSSGNTAYIKKHKEIATSGIALLAMAPSKIDTKKRDLERSLKL